MYSDIRLYRKRFIPAETNFLKDDKILYMDEDLIVTSWNSINPRADIGGGISAYYRREGYKISRVTAPDGTFVHWYCDIISESGQGNELTFTDLLVDVVITPDGTVRVVDLDEAADALEQGLITQEMLIQALRNTDKLLRHIKQGTFDALTECIMKHIN